ncbi:MAG: citramalate synthase [Clostridia bacterium]|nr:citramalate synthase [Clostridia bacterium]
MKIQVFDTTLRDGAQGFGISFTEQDKIKIIRSLDSLGVDYVEIGNFALSEDLRLFERASAMELEHARLVGFGATRYPNTRVEDNEALVRAASCPLEAITIFGKAHLGHVRDILRTTPEENLRMIHDTVSYLVSKGKEVFFDAEHFFNGYADDAPYAMTVLKTALQAGASAIVLCDTNGDMLPDIIGMVTERVRAEFKEAHIGIHTHNDLGMAVACTLSGVLGGADSVQVTVSGIGERCGNANLSTVVPLLQLKMGYQLLPEGKLSHLTSVARYINEVANRAFDEREPFVGGSAFTHKAGMHVDAVHKDPASFEHIDPSLVGNERNILVTSLSGRSAIHAKMLEFSPTLSKDSPLVQKAVDTVKSLEAEGYRFEDAEGSLSLRLREAAFGESVNRFFALQNFRVLILESQKEREPICSATVKISVGGAEEITAAEGEGPVNALDLALRKALIRFYPSIASIRLCDYTVRVLDSGSNTASKVLVRVSTTDGTAVWRTVGVSPDIIDASWQALSDSMVYFLEKEHH